MDKKVHRWNHHSHHSRFLHCLLTGIHSVAQCAGPHETTSWFVTGRRRRWKPATEFSRQTWLVTEWGGYPQQDKLLKTEKFVISTVFLQCCSMLECYLRGEKLFQSNQDQVISSQVCLVLKFLVKIGRDNVYYLAFVMLLSNLAGLP